MYNISVQNFKFEKNKKPNFFSFINKYIKLMNKVRIQAQVSWTISYWKGGAPI